MPKNYLLDTCAISELSKPKPNQGLVDWLRNTEEENLYLSVLTIGEVQQGIEKLPNGKKKEKISQWFDFELIQRFSGRVITISEKEAIYWGKISATAQKNGHTPPVIDALLAASAISNQLIVVTNDILHFEKLGADIINPWT